MTNPPPRISALRKVVATARALVTYQVGIPVGAQRMNGALLRLRPHQELDYPIFSKYLAEVRELPLGSERLETDLASLKRMDKSLEKANSKHRDSLFDACYDIIERFGREVGPTPEVEDRPHMRGSNT